MKRFALLSVLSCFLFSSCSKDYTCTCTNGTDSYSYDLKDIRSSEADEACDLAGDVWIVSGGSCTATVVE